MKKLKLDDLDFDSKLTYYSMFVTERKPFSNGYGIPVKNNGININKCFSTPFSLIKAIDKGNYKYRSIDDYFILTNDGLLLSYTQEELEIKMDLDSEFENYVMQVRATTRA